MKIRPQHPALDDTLAIDLDLAGDAVKAADVEVGFHHRGLEKMFESATFEEGVGIAGHAHAGHHPGGQSSPSALGYVIACEELLGVVPPRRAEVLRVILAELTRLGEHLGALYRQARAAGAEALASLLDTHWRMAAGVLNTIAGGGDGAPLVRIGGLRSDISESALEPLVGLLKGFPEFLVRLTGGGVLQKLFAMRLSGVGRISRDAAIARGLSGPPLRASGVDHDIRKARPYCGYERYDFAIPTQAAGDAWARFVQRAEECRESLRIIAQARDDLRPGAVSLDLGVPEPSISGESDAPRDERENEGRSDSAPEPGDEIYSSTEAPSGELGYFVVAADSSRPHRVRIRTPSFYHAAALSDVLVGEKLADVPLVVASFGLVASEIDR